jgi:murein DD-endopeptidase MepM/ murein hydrolase activator NlpD
MSFTGKLQAFLNNPVHKTGKIVDFDPLSDRLLGFDFTANNTALNPDILNDTGHFSAWVSGQLTAAGARYGIGGYGEHRTIYSRSRHFDTAETPRRLHLGVDIWGPAGTPVYNFYEATVHSFGFNDNFGDYGATIILQYALDGLEFYALYGHLNLASLSGLEEGQHISAGQQFARFGLAAENGYWPPHLHFQLIINLQGNKGDYPGVCTFEERTQYLQNCPDPALLLKPTFLSALP